MTTPAPLSSPAFPKAYRPSYMPAGAIKAAAPVAAARTIRLGPALLTLPAAPILGHSLKRGNGPLGRWLRSVHMSGRFHQWFKAVRKKVPFVADDVVIAAVKKLETKA